MRVLKFGGTSVGSVENLRAVCEIVAKAAREDRVVVVVSALAGVTDSLVAAVNRALARDPGNRELVAALAERHQQSLDGLAPGGEAHPVARLSRQLLARLEELLDGISLLGECSASTWARILATGERLSAPLLTAGLHELGVQAESFDGTSLVVTNSRFQEAEVDFKETQQRVVERMGVLPPEVVAVVTGFIGADPHGRTTTLGRGGSDYTASLLGACLEADQVEIWTDVNGVLSAEPRLVPEAFSLAQISYGEAAEMAYFGAKVMHPKMMYPLADRKIPIAIRNTLEPDAPGTRISETAEEAGEVKVITSMKNVSLLSVGGNGETAVPEMAQRLFGSLVRSGLQLLMVSHASSDASTSLVVPTDQANRVQRALEREFCFELEHGRLGRIQRDDAVSLVAAVGDGIRERPTVGGRVLRTLSRARIQVVAVSCGASSRHLSVVVREDALKAAVSTLHRSVVLKRRRIHLFVAGASGQVGRELLAQLGREQGRIGEELDLDLRLVGAANSRAAAWRPSGLDLADLPNVLAEAEDMTLEEIHERFVSCRLEHRVFVDCTASDAVAGLYPSLLEAGVGVVTPNKLANTGPYAHYQRLQALSRGCGVPYRYETTVGAALPTLAALEDLIRSGDRLRQVSGVLSGTLSFLFHRLNDGRPFSAAVREARDLGFTEPDPRADLGGADAGRKLLILLREAGLAWEWGQLSVESLVPEDLAGESDPERFLAGLEAHDESWAARVDKAAQRGERLAYVARWDGETARVGVTSVPAGETLGHLRAGENMVVYFTDRYDRVPLTVAGPGAGPAVTAAGVLADVVTAARQLVDAERPQPRIEVTREVRAWKVPA